MLRSLEKTGNALLLASFLGNISISSYAGYKIWKPDMSVEYSLEKPICGTCADPLDAASLISVGSIYLGMFARWEETERRQNYFVADEE